jgi:hypothetical protein
MADAAAIVVLVLMKSRRDVSELVGSIIKAVFSRRAKVEVNSTFLCGIRSAVFERGVYTPSLRCDCGSKMSFACGPKRRKRRAPGAWAITSALRAVRAGRSVLWANPNTAARIARLAKGARDAILRCRWLGLWRGASDRSFSCPPGQSRRR